MNSKKGARAIAHTILSEVEAKSLFASEALQQHLSTSTLDSRDRALVVELVNGVLRRRETLDWYLGHVSDRKVNRLPVPVRSALRLGAYQLYFLERVPPSAAVNESVNLLKSSQRRGGGRWPGFVNAVLRELIRTDSPAWPDRSHDPTHSLSVEFSCPPWLVQRWLKRFGLEETMNLCQNTLLVPPVTIRTNTLRMSRDELMSELLQKGYEIAPTTISSVGIVVKKPGLISDLPGFQEGWFYVEDEGGQLVSGIVNPQAGECILDACAAPGGKATHMAALMKDQGQIIAIEPLEGRRAILDENTQRMGVTCLRSMKGDFWGLGKERTVQSLRGYRFDRILVDAPCSGTGVFKRHPEGKWQKHAAQLVEHQTRQLAILHNVSDLLRPGGTLVYSTCSTEPEENEHVIKAFCSQHQDFMSDTVSSRLPSAGQGLVTGQGYFSTIGHMSIMDGFFSARLTKVST